MMRALIGYTACGIFLLILGCGTAFAFWLLGALRHDGAPLDPSDPHDDAYPESESEPIEPAEASEVEQAQVEQQQMSGPGECAYLTSAAHCRYCNPYQCNGVPERKPEATA